MERKTQNAIALAEQMKPEKQGKLYKELSDAHKEKELSAEIEKQAARLQNAIVRGKVDLSDVGEVQAATMNYLEACKLSGCFPTFTGLAASFGCSRQNLNQWLLAHPQTETANFISLVRTSFADILMQMGLKRNADTVLSIFLLKNSSQGFSDRVEVEPVPPQEEDKLTAADIARKYEWMGDD